jgi:hypothetical protein
MKMTEVNAHKLVSNLCEEMAQTIYEELAKRNNFYAMYPDRREFVREIAPTLREDARRTLAEMLSRNDVALHEKEAIHEALILDKTIPQTGMWQAPRRLQ